MGGWMDGWTSKGRNEAECPTPFDAVIEPTDTRRQDTRTRANNPPQNASDRILRHK